jgi:uncharacterized membrane protein YkoI
MKHCISALLALLLLLVCSVAGVRADDRSRDQDTVRQAVERGEIRALAEILTVVRGELRGDVVKIKIERERGRWYYEIRVVDGEGRLFEVYVDAKSGAIDRIKEK